jgi:peptidoglycan/LPS O-acetylase OafA/YrhL
MLNLRKSRGIISSTNEGSSNKKFWIGELDYLRGFAIIAVIMIHTTAYFTVIGYLNLLVIINILIDIFSHFAVPLFIFISGVVLSSKYFNSFSHKIFYIKRAKHVIPQYLIFSIGYLLFSIIINSSPMRLKVIIFKILTASSYYHLWFFAIIIEFYIAYPILIKIYQNYERKGKTDTLITLSLFIQIITNVLILVLWSNLNGTITDKVLYLVSERIFISYLFYFMVGIHVGRNFNLCKDYILSVKPYKIITIIGILTVIISLFWISGIIRYGSWSEISKLYFIVPTILGPLFYLSIFLILFKISSYFSKIKDDLMPSTIYELGRLSFGIYLIHIFFLESLAGMLSYINIHATDFIFYPLIFLGTIVLSYISILVISYLPYSNLIVGFHTTVN